jgi:hypothetical protein
VLCTVPFVFQLNFYRYLTAGRQVLQLCCLMALRPLFPVANRRFDGWKKEWDPAKFSYMLIFHHLYNIVSQKPDTLTID